MFLRLPDNYIREKIREYKLLSMATGCPVCRAAYQVELLKFKTIWQTQYN